MLKIYNTMTRKLEEFVPIKKGEVGIYVCGPTVYNYIHLGNARPVIVFDTFARYLKYKNYKVNFVQNFTDVDDKIINKAKEENVTTDIITEKYIKAFFEDIQQLNILEDVKRPKVTENIKEIIEMIKILEERGFAYNVDGNVFFEENKYSNYGRLSNRKIEDAVENENIEAMSYKRNAVDFALWKKKKEGEVYWDSPWGQGRPGWHIECSAMSKKYLGESFDIHGGGQDLIFPHHENEIAQSVCSSKHGEFAKYWMHNGFIQIDGDKMSKSLNNFFLLREILEKYSGNVIRLFMLSTHYRKPINFSINSLEDTKNSLNKIIGSLRKYKMIINEKVLEKDNYDNEINDDLKHLLIDRKLQREAFLDIIEKQNNLFDVSMDDDMNTPRALASIFEQLRETNKFISDIEKKNSSITLEDSEVISISYNSIIKKFVDILGIDIEKEFLNIKNEYNIEEDEMSEKLLELLKEIRENARKNKDFVTADLIRDRLKELGIELVDKKI